MRQMDFSTERLNEFEVGQEYNVTESRLPSSYCYTLEHALGISNNFKGTERLISTRGIVIGKKETPRFNYVVLEFDE